MSNKLKNIFSNEMFDLGGKIGFQDIESYKKFLKALKIVQNDGTMVEVDGISSFITSVKDGGMEYPFLEKIKPDKFIIAPSKEDVPILLDTEYGKRTILFRRYYTTKEIILETSKDEIIYFKISFIKNTSNVTFTYRPQPNLAKTVKDIIESCNTATIFLNKFFSKNNQGLLNEYTLICNMKKAILDLKSLFNKAYLVEQDIRTSFNPAQFSDTGNELIDLEELYLLLIEKKAIRLNEKISETKAARTSIKSTAHKLEVGNKLDITFVRNVEYTVCNQKIAIYAANLISNAIVKEIKEDEDGGIKVLYDDTDSQPTYISYTGFKTSNEADQEAKSIMDHKEKYVNALTLNEYINNEN